MIPRMNLFASRVLCRNLARMTKSHLRDDSAEAVQLSALFLSCQQSKFEVLYPIDKLPFEPDSVCPLLSCLEKGQDWPAYNVKIEFPGDFNWENKGLAFCARSIGKGSYLKFYAIYINGVRIKESFEEKREDHPWRLTQYHLRLYYVPFHTIIRRLSESGLPPPSMCLVKLEFEVKGQGKRGMCGVHIVMPEDDDGVIIHQVDNSDRGSEDDNGISLSS